MLTDPLSLLYPGNNDASLDGGTGGSTLANPMVLIDNSESGKTVRIGTLGSLNVKLVITHTETRENKPYGTKRVNVRLSASKDDANGVLVETAWQVTAIQPKGSVFTATDNNALRRVLAALTLTGEADGTSQTVADGDAFFARLLNGEG